MAVKKEQYWEVVAPEPFVIDTRVTDEQFISEMVSVSNSEEITDLIHSYLQGPTTTFIIHCSENELKKMFNISGTGYKTKMERDCVSIFFWNFCLDSRANNKNYLSNSKALFNFGKCCPTFK